MQKYLAISCLLPLLLGCVGPLLNHETGRSLGNSNHDIKIMSTADGYYGFNYDYGISENFDLGFAFEALSFGLKAKYSFINSKTGLALAGALGTGSTWGGSYYTAAVIASYGVGQWEPFGSLRFTQVDINEQDFKDSETGDLFLTTPAVSYNYMQAFVGTKYWFAQWFALSFEAGSFLSSTDVEFEDNVYLSLATEFAF